MKLLIAPRSPLPIRVKALFRWMIWHARLNQMQPSFYGEGVPGWVASYSWRDLCICFQDTEGGLHYRW